MVLGVLGLASGPAAGQVFVLKGCGSSVGICLNGVASEPPTRLLSFLEDGSLLTSIGDVEIDGTPIAGDGLALSANLGLYGFELVGPVPAPVDASQLLSIDPQTGAATRIGAALAGRSIRGATFDEADRLWVLDAASDELLEVDPATGSLLGSPVPVTRLGSGAFDVTSANDLAMRAPGDFVMVDANAFYSLDLATGVAALLFLDTDPDDETPNPYFFAGLAASEDGSLLFAFDVTGEEDIVEYTAAFSRSEIYSNVLPSFNSGRGDLASAYVAPAVPSTGPLAGLALVALASTLAIRSLSRTRRARR